MFSSVLDVSAVCFVCVFPDVCFSCVYLDVEYVVHICCMCSIWMFAYSCNGFQVCFMCVFQVFHKYVFKCFNCL